MQDEGRGRARDLILEATALAARAAVAIGFTVLGAGVVVVRRLLSVASTLLPSCAAEAPTGRRQARKIRERAVAAQRAARASGLLSPRR
jgi:hypothetical protein